MKAYKAKVPGHPGAWYRAPYQGITNDPQEAAVYPADHPHLLFLSVGAKAKGYRLVLTPVEVGAVEVKEEQSRDRGREAGRIVCPSCRGAKYERVNPDRICKWCDGQGTTFA